MKQSCALAIQNRQPWGLKKEGTDLQVAGGSYEEVTMGIFEVSESILN